MFQEPFFGTITASSGGYVPAGAIWLDGSADYLSRTFGGAADNGKINTISFWIKPLDTATFSFAFDCGGNEWHVYWSSGTLNIGTSAILVLVPSALYRDYSAWMHIVIQTDTTQATAANRFTLWVNGVEVTAFGTDARASIAQNTVMAWGSAVAHHIGADAPSAASYVSCYLAEFISIDGTAYSATDFGEFDTNGNWVPIDPSGLTFGTNGFWLDFAEDEPTRITSGTKTSSAGTAANAFDDNTGTINNFATQSDGQWVKLNYGSAIEVVRAVIWQEQINPCGYTVAIQYSDNDSDWTTAATKSHAASLSPTYLSWNTVGSHQYWRCYFTSWTGSSNANVAEFILYGTYGLGKDLSGNRNDFTTNSMSSANATNDNPADDAENGYGNFATPSPLDPGNSNDTFAKGNLDTSSSSGSNRCRVIPFALQSGKWYWEVTYGGGTIGAQIPLIGNKDTTRSNYPGYDTNSLGVHSTDGDLYDGSGGGGLLENRSETTTTSDVWGIAFDADNRKLWVSLNGTYFDSGDPAAGTNADFTSIASTFMFPLASFDSRTTLSMNFGQKAFNTAPPTGFKPVCTANLPAPASAASVTPLTGSFTGNAAADGPLVWLGYTPDTAETSTINGNTITWGTHARATAGGFKVITSSSSYNAAGSNTYSIAVEAPFGGDGVAQARAR